MNTKTFFHYILFFTLTTKMAFGMIKKEFTPDNTIKTDVTDSNVTAIAHHRAEKQKDKNYIYIIDKNSSQEINRALAQEYVWEIKNSILYAKKPPAKYNKIILDVSYLDIKAIKFPKGFKTDIKKLILIHCLSLEELEFLNNPCFEKLETLVLDNCGFVTHSWTSERYWRECSSIKNSIFNLWNLLFYKTKTLIYGDRVDISCFAKISNLKELSIIGSTKLETLDFLEYLPELKMLKLHNCKNLKNFDGIKHANKLETLSIIGIKNVQLNNLKAQDTLTKLYVFTILITQKTIDKICEHTKLEQLQLFDARYSNEEVNLKPIDKLDNLYWLKIPKIKNKKTIE